MNETLVTLGFPDFEKVEEFHSYYKNKIQEVVNSL